MAETEIPVASGLMRVLAETFALYTKTHGYHWNVRGAEFSALHKLFNDQYDEIWGAVDTIAERIRALGELVPMDFPTLATIKTGDAGKAWRSMVQDMIAGNETVCEALLEAQALAETADDQATLTILADRLIAHGKHIWMLQATLG
jgi:starvation-inducible DNA-binding protein